MNFELQLFLCSPYMATNNYEFKRPLTDLESVS